MLFHSQLINSAREAAGRSAVNGLWPWGGGPLPTLSRVFSDVWTDNPLVRGSALVSGATVHAIASPPCAPNAGNNGLIVMELPDTAQAWKIWDETWGAALHEFVRHGVVDELLILDGEGETFRVTRPALRRWWRRPKSLGKHPQ
jgi:hypothetical protein